MFFRSRRRDKAEDLNRKVEKFRRWWQEGTGDLTSGGSNRSRESKPDRKASDSSFVYYEEG